ncbi:MAG: asparagine synthase (glutamine-hydrolyzing) [Deltaproteobacteria bacterium]|nr:asparagine synthase (glutamine-hydrolyzing) [Deltaproteobacteria bacterium]
MCGIVALFAATPEAAPPTEQELLAVRESMASRGPDGSGSWYSSDSRVALGHRRLAIIDLSPGGAQPMRSADGTCAIVFNGEIYNHRELRCDLEARGVPFRSQSDTEVLLAAYLADGPAMLTRLRGMFSFALWDGRERRLLLARDPYGIKPLYYSFAKGRLVVASQVKAILKAEGIDRSPDPAGHAGFFLWGHVPEPYTLYQGIRSVPAGATVTVCEGGRIRTVRYCGIPEMIASAAVDPPAGEGDRSAFLGAALRDSVRAHLVADVPVGLFLSSGIDSTMIASLAAEAGGRLHSVTLGFEEYRGTPEDETPLAKRVAARLGLEHDTVWVHREEFEEDRDRLLAAMDQPSIDGVNSWFVSKAAAAVGMKVALSGLGGDELFGGYPSFRQVPRSVSLLRPLGWWPALGAAGRRVAAPLLTRMTSPKFASLLEYGSSWGGAYLLRRGLHMPWELPAVMDPDMARAGLQELRTLDRLAETEASITDDSGKMTALESCWYMRNQLLRDADWASMAHSLEVRVPLVDARLLEAVRGASSAGSPVTKREVAGLVAARLPDYIRKREKTGFSIPVRNWYLKSAEAVVGRGLRGWGRRVYGSLASTVVTDDSDFDLERTRKFVVLATDGYGARGGIAQHGRDLMEALCNRPDCGAVMGFPRHAPDPFGPLPIGLMYSLEGCGGKVAYLRNLALRLPEIHDADMIICGHINLAPLGWALKRKTGAPLLVFLHGVDAWKPVGGLAVRHALKKLDAVVSVSSVTLNRFLTWAPVAPARCTVLPNAIHLNQFSVASDITTLRRRYGLEGKRVLLTVGRIVSQERAKGFDEVLDVLPSLLREMPDLAYLVVGEGDDLPRLRRKANDLGISFSVVFAGYVPEEEKAAHFRLADAYVMPSRGEGFGYVFLEAMASGVPVVASILDGGREAVLDGRLGVLVDPDSRESIANGIREALARPKGVPEGLDYFSYARFGTRLDSILDRILPRDPLKAA